MELHKYRPISVLNTFSKICERLMYTKLVKFLDRYNIIYHNQFGFRQRHSTHHAIITLVDKITKSLDHGDIVIGIFLDRKKILLWISGKRFESYLTNRS